MSGRGLVTISASTFVRQGSPTATPALSPHEVGQVWLTTLTAEECCLLVCLQEDQPVAIVTEEGNLQTLVGVLKTLLSPEAQCVGVSVKTQRQQASKLIRKSITHTKGVLVATPDTVLFAQSCLPQGVRCKTLLHLAPVETVEQWRKRSTILAPYSSSSSPDQINLESIKTLGKQIVVISQKDKRNKLIAIPPALIYPFKKQAMPAIQARIGVAKKLYFATVDASALWKPMKKSESDVDLKDFSPDDADADDKRRGMAGKIEALKAKLKVLASVPLPGVQVVADGEGGGDAGGATPSSRGRNTESNKSLRLKMEILGMLHVPDKVELAKQVESGRSLASTRWIDQASGHSQGWPWGVVRYGASCDSCSRNVQEVVQSLRDYVDSKAGRKLPKREQEIDVVPRRLKTTLAKQCRVVAFGWRPSVFGDGEEWGGRFGKACAHNEVSMFFARPFFPLEVLNTHVCSMKSPAPGNEGHDGCMEFLRAQCIFFSQPFTVWDDKNFHWIDAKGTVSSLKKSSLLHLSDLRLKLLVPNLRRWTIESEGRRSPSEMIEAINLLLDIAFAKVELHRDSLLCTPNVSRAIVSYLVSGNLRRPV